MANEHDPWGNDQKTPQNKPASDNKPGNWQNDQQQVPNVGDALEKLLDMFKGGKSGGGNGNADKDKGSNNGSFKTQLPMLFGIIAVLVAVWFAMGFYVIDEKERGVTLRLGKYQSTLEPGLQWQPFFIDDVYKVNVTSVREQLFDSEMLTVDENIVNIKSSVQYVIKNPKDFVLAIRDSEASLSLATDSSMRHVVGSTTLDDVITIGREKLGDEVLTRMQGYLDSYSTGLLISKMNILESRAPDEVKPAFDDVIKAREDRVRVINQATTYENGVIPEARGAAKRLLAEANGYKESIVARAVGEADRFSKIYFEYVQAPEVTRKRLFLQTLEKIYGSSSKVLLDVEQGNNLLYLPLDKLGSAGALLPSVIEGATSTTGQTGQTDVQNLTNQVIDELRKRQSATRSGTAREGR